MEFRLLGPVEVHDGERVLDVGPPQQRHVLAALAIDAGQPVTAEALIDRVWDAAPDGARRALRVHISRIKQTLGQAASDTTPGRLVRRSGGYLLDADPNQIDVHRFHRLAEQARNRHPSDGERIGLLREAVSLWRGEPLAGLPGQWAQRTRRAWHHQYLDAVLARADAELHAGNPTMVIGPLTQLAGEHPLDESLAATLMRALTAAGRAADALAHYDRTRRRLAEDLGVDPGADLQAVHQMILRGDPVGTPLPAAARTTPPTALLPAQLPADVAGFAGRTEQLARLDHLLKHATDQPTAVVISAIAGTAGVGKTALAVHWAHQVRQRFPDGQLYVNLRGFHPTGSVMDPAEAIRGFLDALSVAPRHIPADLDAQAALYRTVLADKRILILLDNARDAEQARPLLPATGGCLAVLTSRHQLSGLVAAVGAHPLTLDLLTDDEARQLLTGRLGSDRVAAEPAAVNEIITYCARLPLALAIVAAHAAAQPHLPLAALAEQLRTAQCRLDVLSTGDPGTDVRAVFSWSYQQLTPAATRLFRLLGLHPGPDISLPAAASLTGLPPSLARPLLTELTRAHLITEPTSGRYALHDLLRAYATEQTHTHDPDPDRHAATHRILDHYLHTAYAADRLLNPQRDPITLTPPQPGVAPEPLTDHGRALAWYITEHRVLIAAIDHAAATRFDTHTWQLASTLFDFLGRRGHWHDGVAAQEAALAAARRSADLSAQAQAHRILGHAHTRLGQYDDAHTHLRHALDLFGQLADRVGQAKTHVALSYAFGWQGCHREALTHAQQAQALFRAAGYRVGQANALNNIGWYHVLLGDHQQALTYCQQALTLQQDLGDRVGEANTWDSLGYAHHHLGHHTQAITCYQHALDLYRDLGNRYTEAAALTHLGDAHQVAADPDLARTAWQHALDILTELDHADADHLRAKLNPNTVTTNKAT